MTRLALALILTLGFMLPVHGQTADAWSEFAYCLTCHGADGQGNEMIQAPALSEIEPWYLKRQLDVYRKGLRGETAPALEMQMVARALDQQDNQSLVDFVQSLKSKPRAAENPGDWQAGATAYAAYCAACHGASGQGNELLQSPAINRLGQWYLDRSLTLYREGLRGGADGNLQAQQMQIALSVIPADVSLDDIVAYLLHLGTSGDTP